MGYGGGAYSGGDPFDKVVRARLEEMWMLPGDERQPPKSLLGTRIGGTEPNSGATGLGARLRQLTANSGVNLICRVPYMEVRQPHDPGSPAGKSLTQYLNELRTESWDKHISKWRGNILLFSHPTWFLEDEMHPPLAEVKRLREAATADGGFLPLQEIFHAAQLPPPQLQWVATEFDGVRSIGNRTNLLSALAVNPLLAAQIQASRGVAVSDLVRRMKDPPTGLLEASAEPDARMRIVSSYMPLVGRTYKFEMWVNGAWKEVDRMGDAGWNKPAAIETEGTANR
jgi:hypothetical protein